eukprot:4769369-Pyramimonas_sp.AAC.1
MSNERQVFTRRAGMRRILDLPHDVVQPGLQLRRGSDHVEHVLEAGRELPVRRQPRLADA